MTSPTHRIRRLRLRVRATSQGDAFALRGRLRALLDDAVLPSLAIAFDESAPGDDVVHLGRLEVRATVSRLDEIGDALPEMVRRELAALLAPSHRSDPMTPHDVAGQARAFAAAADAIVRASGSTSGLDDVPEVQERQASAGGRPGTRSSSEMRSIDRAIASTRTSGSATVGPPTADADRDDEGGGERISSREELVRVLARYLATGALPWHATSDDYAFRAAAAQATVDQIKWALTASAIDRADVAHSLAWFRLLQLLPEERWAATGQALTAAGGLADAIGALAGYVGGARHARLRVASLAITAARPAQAGGGHLAAALEGWHAATALPGMPAAVTSFFKRLRGHEEADPAQAPGPAAAPASAQVGAHASRDAGPPGTSTGAAPIEPAARMIDAAASDPSVHLHSPAVPVDEAFGLPARFAGLILLHPFLPRLLEQTGIRQPGQASIDEAVLPRAAALLHACAAGDEEPFEYQLGFIKILLGLPPEEPLPIAAGLLGANDLEEVGRLLAAAIQHWTVLRNTSPAALRATFLRRGGLVREDSRGFRLQVEHSGVDVLLGHLPWGIGVVKLPWMNRAIFTEWPTH